MMDSWGYTHTDGIVYGDFLLSDKPLTISVLSEMTSLSRSSISVSINKLVKEYLAGEKEHGKTKYFTSLPAFVEKFFERPKELLRREVTPLMNIIEKLIKTSDNEDYKERPESIKEDLLKLTFLLKRIIEMEKGERYQK